MRQIFLCIPLLFIGCLQAQESAESKGHFGKVHTAAFSPDGTKIVTASYDGTARIWDVESGEELLILPGHSGHSIGCNFAAFSPDGRIIVTQGGVGSYRLGDSRGIDTVRLWDAETGNELRRLEGSSFCDSIAFSPDGTKVVAAGWDTVFIWEVDSGKVLQKIEGHTKGHTRSVLSAAFSSDSKKIVTSGWDNTARIWDVETGKELKKLEGPTPELLAFGGEYLPVWIGPTVFSPCGKKVVAATATKGVPGDNAILTWDIESGKVLQKWKMNVMNQVQTLAFSPDGKKVIAVYRCLDDKRGWYDTLIWDAELGKELLKFPNISGIHGMYAVFSPDGKNVLTVVDNAVMIWDAETGKELKKWTWEIRYWRN
ncbi:MAG: WD40 repeat domain-containing protein [Planctomycetaceae bacterium]|nr:WD40 repeat domain-containing protein [Planctomycetaceae bacterium]